MKSESMPLTWVSSSKQKLVSSTLYTPLSYIHMHSCFDVTIVQSCFFLESVQVRSKGLPIPMCKTSSPRFICLFILFYFIYFLFQTDFSPCIISAPLISINFCKDSDSDFLMITNHACFVIQNQQAIT